MSTADAVNRITDKLNQSKITWLTISDQSMKFLYGNRTYVCLLSDFTKNVTVYEMRDDKPLASNFSVFVEGVLNGKTRNDAGELAWSEESYRG